MPTISSASRQRSSACARGTSACVRMASIICSPMRSTGFSVISGSWKIIAMRSPRSWRICSSLYLRRSWPLKRTSPSTTSRGSIRPSSEKPVTDLPEPDSPTRPTISPRRTVRSTPSTAGQAPASVWNAVRRPRTSRMVSLMSVIHCANRHAGIGCRSIGVPRSRLRRSASTPLEGKRAALRGGPHLFGSRLSRRRSPTMLMDRISSSRAMPGNRLIQ